MSLRPYQTEALENIRNELRAGKRAVLLVSPTGSGKTQIAAEMVRSSIARGNSVLFVAHRRELVTQAVERLRKDHGIEAGVIMAGHKRVDGQVMVASIQTLLRRQLPVEPRLLVADEAHHAAADSWKKLLAAFPRAVVIGLTATPWRLDGRGLGNLFESSVVAATPQQLMDQGYLCDAVGHCYVPPDISHVAMKGGDYDAHGLSLAYAQSKVLGDIVERWFEHCGPGVQGESGNASRAIGRRTILFASSIENSMELIERFRARGIAAEHLDYKTPSGPRHQIIERVRSGETTIISNVGILGEGVDVPELECAILARPSKSVAVYLQQVGRVLRPAEGKARAIIHDHAGCLINHGFWYQERNYSLRPDKPKGTGGAPVKTCPECFCCCAAGCRVCPECGAEFPVDATKNENAEHVEKTLEEMKKIIGDKFDRDQLLHKYMLQARQTGKRPGWVLHRVRDDMGEFPFPRAWWSHNVEGVKGDFRWRVSE